MADVQYAHIVLPVWILCQGAQSGFLTYGFYQANDDIIRQWSPLTALAADGQTFCALTHVWHFFFIMIIIFHK